MAHSLGAPRGSRAPSEHLGCHRARPARAAGTRHRRARRRSGGPGRSLVPASVAARRASSRASTSRSFSFTPATCSSAGCASGGSAPPGARTRTPQGLRASSGWPSSVTVAPGPTGCAGSVAATPSIAIRPLRASRSTERLVPSPASARYRFRRTSAPDLPGAAAQRLDLGRCEEAPRSRGETAEPEAAVGRAVQRHHGVSDRLDHAPHLAVAPLVQHELDDRRHPAHQAHLGRRGRAVVEHHAVRERCQAARRRAAG